MAHGGYARRRLEERRPVKARRAKGLGPDKRGKKVKSVSIKNQIRSTERYLRKELPNEVREAQQKKLEELKKQLEIQNRLVVEREIQLRDRKIKFFERRKIERMIRRLEKQLRTSSDHATEAQISSQLSKLKEDLEYVRFFPKNEKYVSLFAGGEDPNTVEKRNKWRKQIKVNSMEAAASGKELEETGSDDDALDISDDDFFMSASSSDDEADDEWTDKSTKEPASSASGKAASGMSSDEKNERQRSARVLMPPPRSLPPSRARSSESALYLPLTLILQVVALPPLKRPGGLNLMCILEGTTATSAPILIRRSRVVRGSIVRRRSSYDQDQWTQGPDES